MAKSKPIGVRFDLDKLEQIKNEQGLKSPQAVVNYLLNNYQSQNPPMVTDIIPCVVQRINKIAPPGLKGIDLAIWKAEQKTKE